MTTNHDAVTDVAMLDFLSLNDKGEPVRPYLVMTTDSTTGEVLDSRICLSLEEITDLQSDDDPEQ